MQHNSRTYIYIYKQGFKYIQQGNIIVFSGLEHSFLDSHDLFYQRPNYTSPFIRQLHDSLDIYLDCLLHPALNVLVIILFLLFLFSNDSHPRPIKLLTCFSTFRDDQWNDLRLLHDTYF